MAIPHQYLPHDIVTDIFLRLPAETLSNARFVNKFWFDFISSSDFVSAHLQKSKKDKTLSGHRVIHSTGDSHLSLEQFSIESSSSRDSFSINTSLDDIDFSNSSRPSVCFVGSCNGLVCLVLNESHVVLWNPCTGSYNRLPQLLYHGGNKPDLLYPDFTYGFGYDEVNDDYKVVALLSFSGLHVMDEETYCTASVYSLKRNSWKRFYPGFAGGVPSWCFGKPVSGKVHWLLGRNIVAFDLANEVFAKVDLPSYGDGCYDRRLDVLDDECLCLLLKDADGTKVGLWVMKEYGVKESWIKMFMIPCANVLGRFDWRPRCLLPNGEILFDFLESFAVCNPKDSSFRFLGIRRFDHGFGPLTYVQSLVSPFGTGRRRRTKVKLVSNVIFTVIVGAFLTLVYLFE